MKDTVVAAIFDWAERDPDRTALEHNDEVWSYAQDKGLCAEEIYDDELPPRRILNPRYEIHTFASDGELVAMSRVRLADPPLKEWESEWPDT